MDQVPWESGMYVGWFQAMECCVSKAVLRVKTQKHYVPCFVHVSEFPYTLLINTSLFLFFDTMLQHRSNARYVGALVADVHNVLINGGIYGYPSTDTNQDGKLRLLYESAPMAMIMEQAGGAGSTGKGRILDVMPTQIHQRVPTFLGSIENVFELDEYHKRYSGTVNSKSVGGDGNNESYLKPTTTSANGDGDIDEITDDETI